jgi:hypothetical protein
MEWLLEVAKQYGPFAALVAWILYKNDQREGKYLTVIQTLSEEVKERLTKIEAKLGRRKNDGE